MKYKPTNLLLCGGENCSARTFSVSCAKGYFDQLHLRPWAASIKENSADTDSSLEAERIFRVVRAGTPCLQGLGAG